MPVTLNNNLVTLVHPKNPKSELVVSLFGATAISWKVNGEDKLWLSEKAILDGSKAVRGGIPIVFPRFGPPTPNHPPTQTLPQHGFARNSKWDFLGQSSENSIQFGLSSTELPPDVQKQWPYDFKAVITFTLHETKLDVNFNVENLDSKQFDFTFLFHTYFRIPSINHVSVLGLDNVKYKDQLTNEIHTREGDIKIYGEFDQIYYDTPQELTIKTCDKPCFTINTSKEITDSVVWNPWMHKASTLNDFYPDNGYTTMVCVESGHLKNFEKLEPHQNWEASVTFTAHDISGENNPNPGHCNPNHTPHC